MWLSRTAGVEQDSVKCRARLGATIDCAHTQVWWTRARRQRQWAQTVAAALEVDSYGGCGTAGSGHERAQAVAGLRARTQCWRLCMPGMLGAEGAVNEME